MRVFICGGGAGAQTALARKYLNESIDHTKPCLYIPLAMEPERYDGCRKWIAGELSDVNIPEIRMVRSARELYKAREKALRDYNSQMQSAREYGFQKGYNDGREAGMEAGMEVGMKAGIQTEKKRMVEKKQARGKSPDQIAEELEEDLETIYRLIKEVEESVPSGV